MEEYGQWDSTITFIFAMIGVAIGLGNIWRFSHMFPRPIATPIMAKINVRVESRF